jgi:hypothetical protein
MTDTELQQKIVQLRALVLSSTHGEKFEEFQTLGAEVLKEIAFRLPLEGTFEVRNQRGYKGFLGEIVLHGQGLYVYCNRTYGDSPTFYYRHAESYNTFSGGANHNFKWIEFDDLEKILKQFRKAMSEPKIIKKYSAYGCS